MMMMVITVMVMIMMGMKMIVMIIMIMGKMVMRMLIMILLILIIVAKKLSLLQIGKNSLNICFLLFIVGELHIGYCAHYLTNMCVCVFV